jgi:hypothetical protein
MPILWYITGYNRELGFVMIFGLGIENFFSIRDYQYIDLRIPPNVPPEPGRLVPIFEGATERAPSVVALFGANASGKSNVLRALSFIISFAKDSFQAGPDQAFAFAKFLTDEAYAAPTHLSLDFSGPALLAEPQGQQCRYNYDLVLDSTLPAVVQKETLSYCPGPSRRFVRLFDRQYSAVKAAPVFELPSYGQVMSKILRPNASLISTLAQLQHPFARLLWTAASRVTSNIGMVKLESTDEAMLPLYQQNEQYLPSLNRELSRLDVGIKGAAIVHGPNGSYVQFDHVGLNSPIPSYFESHGTRQFFRIFPYLTYALSNGGVAILDELDISIHPKLLPEIVGWFSDPERNPHGAQLWMTCQTVSLLEDLIKEEIFFCEKDASGQTSIFGLRDIRGVRRLDNFYQKYLGGVYGAVPRVG